MKKILRSRYCLATKWSQHFLCIEWNILIHDGCSCRFWCDRNVWVWYRYTSIYYINMYPCRRAWARKDTSRVIFVNISGSVSIIVPHNSDDDNVISIDADVLVILLGRKSNDEDIDTIPDMCSLLRVDTGYSKSKILLHMATPYCGHTGSTLVTSMPHYDSHGFQKVYVITYHVWQHQRFTSVSKPPIALIGQRTFWRCINVTKCVVLISLTSVCLILIYNSWGKLQLIGPILSHFFLSYSFLEHQHSYPNRSSWWNKLFE